ncbi:ComF family protein [Calderihabitans maritimus]|uniref:Phosphoribosyltransferase n=1 Tax=Calderihabitans maritimus TaxID=1246530 RepID=A0A1Z5HUR1_9FIRM|nr:ComF family protein [Calderihabitans maritimus]GAW93148.1 phosphoribosyltransferase [Calderihabitans maritimus]
MGKNIWHSFLELIYPSACSCPVCGRRGREVKEEGICSFCFEQISVNRKSWSYCLRCGRTLEEESWCMECRDDQPPFHIARAVGLYEGVLKEAVHCLKYRGKPSLSRPLGRLMAKVVETEAAYGRLELVVPVPLHPVRLRERGYNQSELLAREVADRLNLPVDCRVLTKTRNNVPQASLSRRERFSNVEGAFAVSSPSRVLNRRILLVDDIFTTGNTIRECSRVLLQAGAQRVSAVVLATGRGSIRHSGAKI